MTNKTFSQFIWILGFCYVSVLYFITFKNYVTFSELHVRNNKYGNINCIPNNTRKDNMKITYKNSMPYCFGYIIENTNFCLKYKPEILVFVYISPNDQKIRSTIRSKLNKFSEEKYVFILGKTYNDTLQMEIFNESSKFDDIIQVSHDDVYENLVYKGITMLKWTHENCPKVKHIWKIDSDIWLQVDVNDIFAVNYNLIPLRPSIACRLRKSKVLRPWQVCWKWCVEPEHYPDMWYPLYCDGSVFLVTKTAIEMLYKKSLETPIWWIDDVFLTGILTKYAQNVTLLDILKYWRKDFLSDVNTDTESSIRFGSKVALSENFLKIDVHV